MNQKNNAILIKIMDYCLEIKDAHEYTKIPIPELYLGIEKILKG